MAAPATTDIQDLSIRRRLDQLLDQVGRLLGFTEVSLLVNELVLVAIKPLFVPRHRERGVNHGRRFRGGKSVRFLVRREGG
jgi:hypothetical protein